ncbi:1-phosphofructokinase family hexose kinase [Sediminibacterium soli]|uniref:1-phosphofructokinase family hexose kinase n=1 Tax=Sediminibacterium soli TaxID=2698829 RepID=UPI00137B809B|nr:1-phosphofructokinase family hexose kinase [Sediminibacterium soli]NCI45402.1 1-phosphofructokinase family hexose kinase [Sediminibacterium soli]
MKKILTLTTNPALDKSITVPELVPDKKLRASEGKTEPGGGGINVSRALKKLGMDSLAVYFSGGYTGKQFDSLLSAEGIAVKPFPIAAATRENFIVVDTSTRQQYRFGMEGPDIKASEWAPCLDWIGGQTGMDFLVASGSLAPGVPPDSMGRLAAIARKANAKLVVDTSGDALAHAVQEGVFLLKPNLGELGKLIGREKIAAHEVADAALSVIQKGGCEIMVVSMGADGAALVTARDRFTVQAPQVEKKSTVGAGDSMVAGILAALTNGWPLQDVLRYGVACGAAAAMNEGTELCKKTDADRLFSQMKRG